VLLVEQVDRLSRLTTGDWEKLKAELTSRCVRVVALDLPTSWVMATANGDEFTSRMFEAINGMLLDMLAAVARKDYDDRRRRQAQGQAKAKAEGRYKGRPEDIERNARIAQMLTAARSPSGDSGFDCAPSGYLASGLPNAHQWTPQSHLEACPEHRFSRDLPEGRRYCASVPK
jgi:DNA invertase Pin-like site-specific DNA recombinase